LTGSTQYKSGGLIISFVIFCETLLVKWNKKMPLGKVFPQLLFEKVDVAIPM
jgi:hypothetical protein